MIITLSTGLLRCAFRYDARIVERMKTIPGAAYDKATKQWTVPAANADKLLDLFPLASYDYDAIAAACDAAAQRAVWFADSLRRWGIGLEIDGDGRVVAVGETVSPLIQDLVTARAEALRCYATTQSGDAAPAIRAVSLVQAALFA